MTVLSLVQAGARRDSHYLERSEIALGLAAGLKSYLSPRGIEPLLAG